MSDQQKIRWPWSLPRSVRRAFRSTDGVRDMPVRICRQLVESFRGHVAVRQARTHYNRKIGSSQIEALVEVAQEWNWVTPEWLQRQMRRGTT